MNRNRDANTWEDRLRRAFGALQATDRRTAPSLEELMEAAAAEADPNSNQDSVDPTKYGVLPDHD